MLQLSIYPLNELFKKVTRKARKEFDKLLIMSCFNQLEKQTEIPQIYCLFSFDIFMLLLCFFLAKFLILEHCPQFKLGLLIQTPWNPTQIYKINSFLQSLSHSLSLTLFYIFLSYVFLLYMKKHQNDII